MADEERGPRREVQTTVTTRFEPLLRKLRNEEWTPGLGRADDSDVVTTAEPIEPAATPDPPVEKPRISKVIRFDASSVDRGFVAARGTQVGKYVLEDKLGQGTFGSVYTARDTELERRVAFKVLNPSHQTNVDVVTRFLQEARATARINHVGIVTILDVGRVPTDLGDLAYIVMELLEGETLSRRIDRVGRLQPADAIEICHQIAGALGAAHKADVLHRDVKPDNIFLVRDPVLASGERVKVLDFGLAKLGRGGHTLANTILGTPRYMSPEQTRSSTHIDKRSDIYSLGCILFELLVGRRPFEGDLATLIERHQREIPQRPKTIVPAVPKSLDDLVARMLAKAPAARPQSMEEVQKELLATAARDREEGAPQVGRSSVDQSLARPTPRGEAKPKAEAKPKFEKPKPKPEPPPDEPKVEIDPELTKEAQAYAESSIDDLPKLSTRVAFPPPPPPPEVESITTTAPAGDASGQTMILDSRRRGKRRRSLPMIAGVTFALAFVAVGAVVIVGRFVSDEGDGAVTRPGFSPTQTADPAKPPAETTVETAKPEPEPPEPAAEPAPAEPEIAIEAKPVTDPVRTTSAPTPAKVRKRPPVVRAVPVRKKPPAKPPTSPAWDPNALFPKKPTASR